MCLLEDAAIQEFHDVEIGADDGWVGAEAVRLWDGNICLGERVYYLVFAIDLVGGF